MMKLNLNQVCPMCGKDETHEIDEMKYIRYQIGKECIQDVFTEEHPFLREFIKTGICFGCQEEFYHTPAPGNEEAWGKLLGECECCGRPVYERDVKDGFKCASCGVTEYSEV